MALVKYNNNSISAVTSAASFPAGAMTLIKTITASSDSTISFVDGSSDVVLDSTYPIYLFKFINIHPASNNTELTFNASVDGGSNYNVTKTTTFFQAEHDEADSTTSLAYKTGDDIAQGTGFQNLCDTIGNDNDASGNGFLHLFDPSNTTFVKHFISTIQMISDQNYSYNAFIAGYGNTTSAIDAIRFKMSSGNIDSGTFKLYGVS